MDGHEKPVNSLILALSNQCSLGGVESLVKKTGPTGHTVWFGHFEAAGCVGKLNKWDGKLVPT